MTEEDLEQEAKLTRRERRAQAKGDDGTTEVRDRNQRLRNEAAAQRKRQRNEERAAAMDEGLGASERVDDALTRSADAAGRFVKSNFAWLQWMIVLGAGAAVATLVLRYRTATQNEKHGHVLASVLNAEFAKVTPKDQVEPRDPRLVDTRKEYETVDARAKNALDAWAGLGGNQAPEVMLVARLGAANAKYDLKKYDEARQAYEDLLKNPKLATALDLKARALEGVGLALEAQNKLPEALDAFKKLDQLDGADDKRLGRFHQARIQHLLGKNDEAKKLLTELNTALSKNTTDDEGPTDYLGAAVRDLLRTVDPVFAVTERQAMEKKQAEEQAKRLQEMIEQMQKKNGNFSLPGMPEAPPAPPIPLHDVATGTPETETPDVAPQPAAAAQTKPTTQTVPAPAAPQGSTAPTKAPAPAAPQGSTAPTKAPAPAAPQGPTAPQAPAPIKAPETPAAPSAPTSPAPAAPQPPAGE